MRKLKPLDAKIIKILLKEGRISYGEIAKECAASKNKVWKRCNALEKKGIITGATTQINFAHLGYAALATLLIRVDAQQIKQAMEIIDKMTEISAQQQYNSVFNIRAFATLRDLNELDHVKQVIRQRLPTIGLKTYIWMGIRNTPENLNLNTSSVENNQNNSSIEAPIPSEVTIDELDEKIIQVLTLDGRLSFTQVAKELGVSTNTIVRRYHKLVKQGTIKVLIQINPNKIGYTSILDCNIAFTSGRETSYDIVRTIAKMLNITAITKTSGDYDLQVTALVIDTDQAFALQDLIATISGVTQIEASARKIPDRWPTPLQCISTV